jgi:hypothetical protein
MTDIVDQLRRSAQAIHLATEEDVARDVSELMRTAAHLIVELRRDAAYHLDAVTEIQKVLKERYD